MIVIRATCDVGIGTNDICNKPGLGAGFGSSAIGHVITAGIGAHRYNVCQEHAQLPLLDLIRLLRPTAQIGEYMEGGETK